jgi:hypothetical protein
MSSLLECNLDGDEREMSKPQILGVKRKLAKPYPLIEILGPIDIGKKKIASLIARRLLGVHFSFPTFSTKSSTSMALFERYTKDTVFLENNPQWWAHIYIANLYESLEVIKSSLEKMPVVVTNYVFSYKAWNSSLGVDMAHFLDGFTVDLPQPNIGYCLDGPTIESADNLDVNLSYYFKETYRKSILASRDKRIKHLKIAPSKFIHMACNRTAMAITDDLKQKYNLPINETELANHLMFTSKKS